MCSKFQVRPTLPDGRRKSQRNCGSRRLVCLRGRCIVLHNCLDERSFWICQVFLISNLLVSAQGNQFWFHPWISSHILLIFQEMFSLIWRPHVQSFVSINTVILFMPLPACDWECTVPVLEQAALLEQLHRKVGQHRIVGKNYACCQITQLYKQKER